MDEQLPAIVSVWDPEEAEPVRSRVPTNPFRKTGRKVVRETFLQDVEGTYHAIGGHQRLIHTANQHPQWFYNRYLTPGVLLPQDKAELDVSIHIHPALQRSPLDAEYTDVTELDRGGDQASGSAAQGAGSAGGGENPREQDAAGGALEVRQDTASSRLGAHIAEHAPRLIEAMRRST